MQDQIFKAYDIRGIYPSEISEVDVPQIAQAYLVLLSEKLSKPIKDLKIAVGRDARLSSPLLLEKAIETFLQFGVTVDDYGPMSSNDYYFVVGNYKYDGGLMATASHNPPEYGGFKMAFANNQHPDSIDFLAGRELYAKLKTLSFPLEAPAKAGTRTSKDYIQEHLQHIFNFVELEKITAKNIVVDSGNGMTAVMIPEIFKKLPGKMTNIFDELDGTFPNRPPNPLTPGAPDKLIAKVREEKADLGVIYDIDGDRMFLVDEKGNFIRGDMILLLLAKAMLAKNPGAGVAYNLICSHAVPELITKWGGRPLRSEVGYMNLSRHMREEGGVMSGEVSAHFAFRDNFYADSGYIALLLVLQTLSEDGRPLSELIKEYSLYHRADEYNLKVADVASELDKIRNKYHDNIRDEIDGITAEFGDWWFNVRASNTEPLLRITVEAKTKAMLDDKQKELVELVQNQ
ncbi:MAG: phosphomannomutase/phosphoglucomutase [Parcubacteria group bacterium]|nr:MAG: phosphomannomutase/phosphoglucomutase [Parcubacteria group bacterium]